MDLGQIYIVGLLRLLDVAIASMRHFYATLNASFGMRFFAALLRRCVAALLR